MENGAGVVSKVEIIEIVVSLLLEDRVPTHYDPDLELVLARDSSSNACSNDRKGKHIRVCYK